MSSKPNEILDLAEQLLEAQDASSVSEVTLRCSASRAYYAALHAADQALPLDIAPTTAERKGKSSHQAVIDAVLLWARGTLRPGRMDAIEVARNLPKLRDARKHADYKLGSDFTLQHAKNALRVAQQTLQSVERAAAKAAEKQA